MIPLDPKKQGEALAGLAITFWVCAYVLRAAYDVIRPALPFLLALVIVVGVIRLALAWRRRY